MFDPETSSENRFSMLSASPSKRTISSVFDKGVNQKVQNHMKNLRQSIQSRQLLLQNGVSKKELAINAVDETIKKVLKSIRLIFKRKKKQESLLDDPQPAAHFIETR